VLRHLFPTHCTHSPRRFTRFIQPFTTQADKRGAACYAEVPGEDAALVEALLGAGFALVEQTQLFEVPVFLLARPPHAATASA
jgi:hypothetical protein